MFNSIIWNLFFGWSIVIGIIAFAFLIPHLVNKFGRLKIKKSHVLRFSTYLSILATIVAIIWEQYIFNVIYYEWDRIGSGFLLIGYEKPILDSSVSWLAKGWTLQQLYGLWIGLLISVYIAAGGITYLLSKNKDKNLLMFIIASSGVLFLTALIIEKIGDQIIVLSPFILLTLPSYLRSLLGA